MRRYLIALLVGGGVVALVLPAASAARGERVEEHTYVRPAGVWTSHFDEGTRSLPEETITLSPRRGDRWVRFEFRDATGRDVLAHITQGAPHEADGVTGVHPYSDGEIVCATHHSFKLHGTEDVHLRLYAGLCPNHTFGYATTGTVIATFAKTG